MKKILKITLYTVGVAILAIACFLAYLKFMLPDVGDAPEMKIEATPARIERGEYLANHVTVCMDCHSKRDWNLLFGPMVKGTEGIGGEVFDQNVGFPGRYIANNITPFHLGNWTDGEVFRAVATGVSKDGRALFSVMPYHNFGQLDEEDIKSLIAYIRTIKPIENNTEASKSDFPMNFIINTLPKKANFSKIPEENDTINYGRYLVTAAGCGECHTKQEKGKVTGDPFAGGFNFQLPDGSIVTSANITPHATGLGDWTEQQFVERFKRYADSSYVSPKVSPGEFQSLMPWIMYAGMKENDLKAIYQYLHTLEPKDNAVIHFTPAEK